MAVPTSFTLHGCRDVWQQMGEPNNIERMIRLLEGAVLNDPALAFDTAKSLIESVCRTIFLERNEPCDTAWDVPKLLKETTRFIGLTPDGHDPAVSDILRRIAGGLQNTIQSLGELRSKQGLIGHGKEANAPELDGLHALFAARAADSLVHFVYTAHRAYPGVVNAAVVAVVPDPLEDYEPFNAYVDELHGEWNVFEVPFKPSYVLRSLDPDAYRSYLTEYRTEQSEEEGNL